MVPYLLRRLVWAVPTLFLLLTLTFFFLRMAPGGPYDGERALTPEIRANIMKKYGLDQPVYVQFGRWLVKVGQGDLDESSQYLGRSVTSIVADSLPTSMLLGFWSLVLAVAIGIPLGCLAAHARFTGRHTWLDFGAMFIAISGVSLPSYLVASVLVLVFSLQLGWLPPALWEGPSSMILPVLTLGSRPLAIIARLTRASMLESLNSDYIRTAYAKGLSDQMVVFKHALKNSLIPVITVVGPIATNLVTGSFLVEMVFQIPGMGKHFVTAVINRDYNLVMGVTLIYGVLLTISHLLTDVFYAWADPRIRLH